MGHMTLTNISNFFVRRLYAAEELTMRECVDELEEAGEGVHGSTGISHERYMLGMAVGLIVQTLSQTDACPCCERTGPVIEPVRLSERQRELLQTWIHEGEQDDWDWDDENPESAGNILDGIYWRFRVGWRRKYGTDEMPVVGNITL